MARAKEAVMNATTTAAVRDDGLARFQSGVLVLMAVGLLVTGLVGEYVAHNHWMMSYLISGTGDKLHPSFLWWMLSVGEIGMVWKIADWEADVKASTGYGRFLIYTAMNGLTIGPVLSLYTGVSVLRVFTISAATFGASALWGVTTKRDLSGVGSFFLMGLFGLIVVMVYNMFLQSGGLDLTISCIGIALFVGLTVWDMQILRELYERNAGRNGLVIAGALSLYLDFINLFLFFLRFFGDED